MICTTKKIKLLLHPINTYISFIMSNTQQLQDFTTQVRRDILRMVHAEIQVTQEVLWVVLSFWLPFTKTL